MAYSEELLNKAKNIITDRRTKAESDAKARLDKAYALCPDLLDIDRHFPMIGSEIIKAFSDPSNAKITIQQLRAESEELNKARELCLKSVGLPADYTAPRYFCPECSDTGYLEYKMCDCMKKELVKLSAQSSGLGTLIGKQSFENFSLDYYLGSDRDIMTANLIIAKNYASDFSNASPSLLMMGDTGLGKTHLSTAIAEKVMEKGYNVLYETSENLISAFSYERFNRGYNDTAENKAEKLLECDMLIIDDFGTEVVNQFSLSVIYNILNTRTTKSLPTIISTNLTRAQIRERYADRIASRLFGEFTVLSFTGKDVRMQKLGRS